MPVVYPANIKTPVLRLHADERIIQEYIDEYNRQNALYKSGSISKEQWYIYALRPSSLGGNVFTHHIIPLFSERNGLREAIRKVRYSDEDWRKLTQEQRRAAYLEMYGNKADVRQNRTQARIDFLDKLKAIDANTLADKVPPDPFEIYTTYDEVDPNTELTVAANQISYTQWWFGGVVQYVSDDKGAGHFTNYDHLHELYVDDENLPGEGCCVPWMLSNLQTDVYVVETSSGDAHCLIWYDHQILLREIVAGAVDDDPSIGLSLDTLYYLQIVRSGTSLICYIRTGSHVGVLVDTLSVTVDGQSFRYISAITGHSYYDGKWVAGYVQNLDLQEGGGGTPAAALTGGAGVVTSAGAARLLL